MPLRIQHIDAIAREKKRDVLYLTFSEEKEEEAQVSEEPSLLPRLLNDYRTHQGRNAVIQFLDEQHITWSPCGHFADVNTMISYQGQIYIDVPFDQTLPEYKKLEAFLENPDGTMRIPHVTFLYLPLEDAMKNAEHDEPGFWERWADNF